MQDDARRTGLVMTAGGARGAYQAGALAELLPTLAADGRSPSVLVGESVGALNAVSLAMWAHQPVDEQVARLLAQWQEVTKPHVLRPLWQQLPLIALRYGGETVGVRGLRLRGLLGVEPLRRTLGDRLDRDRLGRNVADGTVDTVGVAATQVGSGATVVFAQTERALPTVDTDVRYRRARLGADHILGSAAIPMLFPPVRIHDGDRAGWYVDGSTRLHTPLLPAVHLGADRLVVIGTTSLRPRAQRTDAVERGVDVGDAAVTLLHAMVEDSLRDDLLRLSHVNRYLVGDGVEHAAVQRFRTDRGLAPYRRIPFIAVTPDDPDEIGDLATAVFRERYRGWRGLRDPDVEAMHRLLGGDSPLQGEILSFVLFDQVFQTELIALGRRDARRWLSCAGADPWATTLPADTTT